MKYLPQLLPLFLLLNVPLALALPDYAPANVQFRATIETTLIHLERSKAERDAAVKDLADSEKQLVEMESRMHTAEEQKIILDRIQKDETGSWSFLQAVLADVGYLRSQWDFLTTSEKTTVEDITKDLSQGH